MTRTLTKEFIPLLNFLLSKDHKIEAREYYGYYTNNNYVFHKSEVVAFEEEKSEHAIIKFVC